MDASDDWEILQPILVDSSSLTSIVSRSHDRQALIRLDYFALDSNSRFDHDTIYSDSEVLPIKQEVGCGEDFKKVGFEGIQEQSPGSFDGEVWDFGGNQELGCDVTDVIGGKVEMVFEESGDGGVVERSESSHVGEIGNVCESKSEEKESNEMVWWKLPLEIVKICVFRVSPAWAISVAAAFVGYVILKRRLSRTRAKSRSIPIKLTVEDKKVSQFMTRATRLNQAFSVVKRVTIMRPLLPAAGVTPWPMLNLR